MILDGSERVEVEKGGLVGSGRGIRERCVDRGKW